MKTSIVVPVLNRADLTAQCLDALDATVSVAVERVLVDNGSTDDTPDLYDRFDVVVRNAENRGFGHGCNQGAGASEGDVIVFLNNDTIPHLFWLKPLVDQAAHGIAGSKLLYEDGRIQHAGVEVDFTQPPGREAWNVGAGEQDTGQYAATQSVTAVTGACLAINRGDWNFLGGFDTGFWNGYEDVDLCLRAKNADIPVTYVGCSTVTHLESESGPERWTGVHANVARLREKWS